MMVHIDFIYFLNKSKTLDTFRKHLKTNILLNLCRKNARTATLAESKLNSMKTNNTVPFAALQLM